MSYSKLKITYNTYLGRGNKHRTLTLPKKVKEYGDKYGYYQIYVDHSDDRFILKGGNEVLMDIDVNGANRYNNIQRIVSYEWLID